jgi:hypothetical protein
MNAVWRPSTGVVTLLGECLTERKGLVGLGRWLWDRPLRAARLRH